MGRFLLAAVGSSGDVNPFLGLGSALRDRGHEVTLLSAPQFADAAGSIGIDFEPLGTPEAYDAIYEDPDLWHPRRGLRVYFGYLAGLVERTAALVEARHDPGRTVVASAFQCFGARVAQETRGVPVCTVLPYPILVQSVHDPNRNPIGAPPRWLPRWTVGWMNRLVNGEVSRHTRAAVNAAREARGSAAPVRDVVGWSYSPSLVLGLWPSLLAAPQPDWPSRMRNTGFVSYDGPAAEAWTPPDDLPDRSDWLVFTPGTQMTHGREYFRVACEAAEALGHPTLMVARDRDALPRTLPRNVTHLDFVPFRWLFPRAGLVVHHGGIGTAGRALECGVPQLIVPRGFDQFDNAARVTRIGAGAWLPRRKLTPSTLAERIRLLLEDPAIRGACDRLRAELAGVDATDETCTALETLLERGGDARARSGGEWPEG